MIVYFLRETAKLYFKAKKLGNATKTVVSGVKNVGSAVVNGVKTVANWAGNAAKNVVNVVKNVGSAVASGVKTAVNWVGNATKTIVNGVKNIYIQAIDSSGRTSELIPMQISYIDAQGPTLTITADKNNNTWATSKTLTVTGSDDYTYF